MLRRRRGGGAERRGRFPHRDPFRGRGRSGGSLGGDLAAGFLVSAIALPLSMGVAVASGFPAAAGLVTAVVGGVLTGFLGGARLTVKGPAAGLIVIVLGAVHDLSDPADPTAGIRRTAAVCAAAGAVQVLLGLLKCGALAEVVPVSVIHGMLAAIGLVIVAKQIYPAMGVDPGGSDPARLLLGVPESLVRSNPGILAIGVVTIAVLWIHPRISWGPFRKMPGVVPAVAAAVFLGLAFDLGHSHTYEVLGRRYLVGPHDLVRLPGPVFSSLPGPDWSAALTPLFLKNVLFLVVVGSIESLLTVGAVDSLDPQKRRADPDADLIAVGLGNVVAGLLGGLPMISEIVRSKAAVDAGATSWRANAIHGVLVLLYAAVLVPVLAVVPTAALAAVLVAVGASLASPGRFRRALAAGPEQFAFFTVTCVVTVTTDLLLGVCTGLASAVAFHLLSGSRPRDFVKLDVGTVRRRDGLLVSVRGDALFSNFSELRRRIETAAAPGDNVTVDFSGARLVDHAFLEKLDRLADLRPGTVISRESLGHLRRLSRHPNATGVRRRDLRAPRVHTAE